MIWAHEVPHIQLDGGDVRIISGSWNEHVAPSAPSASWANDPENEVALYILTVKARFSRIAHSISRSQPHDVSHRWRYRHSRIAQRSQSMAWMYLPTVTK